MDQEHSKQFLKGNNHVAVSLRVLGCYVVSVFSVLGCYGVGVLGLKGYRVLGS